MGAVRHGAVDGQQCSPGTVATPELLSCSTCRPHHLLPLRLLTPTPHPPLRSYYVDLISRQGLIGIVLAQSPEFVAPHGAKQPIFGTNPIGISIPAQVCTSTHAHT